MFSRSLAAPRGSRRRLALFAVAFVAVTCVGAPAHARVTFTAGETSSRSEYENQIHNAARTEGDIWGGEQITQPDVPVVRQDDPIVVTAQASTTPWSVERFVRWWSWFVAWLPFVGR